MYNATHYYISVQCSSQYAEEIVKQQVEVHPDSWLVSHSVEKLNETSALEDPVSEKVRMTRMG